MTARPRPPKRKWLQRWLRLLLVLSGALFGVLLAWALAIGSDAPSAFDTDPASILEDPELMFEQPSLLADAVERRVNEAVRSCMAGRGHDYVPPTINPPLGELTDPEQGHGETTDRRTGADLRRVDRLDAAELDGYETALYGAPLDVLDEGQPLPGSCAADGLQVLETSLALLARSGLGYEAVDEVQSDPGYRRARARWLDCVTERSALGDLADQIGDLLPTDLDALPDAVDRLAEARFECRREHLAGGEAAAVRRRFAEDVVARHRPELAALVGED